MSSSGGASKATLYVDMMSQPSRALVWFCRLADIPHEVVTTHIARGEHKSESFSRINRFKKLPAAEVDGVCLIESHTILRYLAEVFDAPAAWYPHAYPVFRAPIDAYLDWHHTNLRIGCATYFRAAFLLPKLQGKEVDPKAVQDAVKPMEVSVHRLDKYWLGVGGDGMYIAGRSVPSIADISAFCELAQLEVLGDAFMASLLGARPKLVAWYNAMKDLDGYDDVFAILLKVKSANTTSSKL